MAFLGLMTVREHEAVVADLKATLDEQRAHWRKSIQDERDSVVRLVGQKAKHLTGIARLQQEVEGLRADVRQAEAAHDKVAAELATLKAERDGILRDKTAETERSVKAVSRGLELTREIEALKPDALKYRERLRRDREALAAKRKRSVAALPKAQSARGGDLRGGV